MATPSPYRSLPSAQRVTLVAHTITNHKEARARFAQRLASRPGGFRASAVQTWPADRLAKEVVRMNAENATDELELLQLLYVELEPAIQIAFLESAGVAHEGGVIDETLEPPFCSSDAVKQAAEVVHGQFGDDGMRYLNALVRYSANAWPDIDSHVTAMRSSAASSSTDRT